MKCPGQDRRYWKGNSVFEVPCPQCGHAVEIFRDESAGRCGRCGHRFANPGADFGCAQWCSLANECLGFAPQRAAAADSKEGALAARLLQWVEQELKSDPTRLAHTLKVFKYAKELVSQEGGDPRVALSAALLLAAGVHQSALAENQARRSEGLPEAANRVQQALLDLGLDQDTAGKVCAILESCRNGRQCAAPEFRIVRDSQELAKLTAQNSAGSAAERENLIAAKFQTETAKSKARGLFKDSNSFGSPEYRPDACTPG